MSFRKYFINLTFFLFNIFFLSNFVFSICLQNPSFVDVYSGNIYLGQYILSDKIYINPNLKTNNLRLEFNFKNIQDNCFTNVDDFKMTLFPDSAEFSAQSFTSSFDGLYFNDIFTFDFSADTTIINDFTATYKVNSLGNFLSSGSLNFGIDTQGPIFSNVIPQTSENNLYLIKAGTNLTLNYDILDSESGLKSVNFNGQIKSFENRINVIYSNSSIFNVGSGNEIIKDYNIVAEDLLGNVNTHTVKLFVDGKPPHVINNGLNKFYSFEDGIRTVTFSLIIEDESFKYSQVAPLVYANFSSIDDNPNYNNLLGNCFRVQDFENRYICKWKPIKIKIENTQNLDFSFNISDSLGNSDIYKPKGSESEIFVDFKPPTILDFYLYNHLLKTKTNVISGYNNNFSVHLKFKDETLKDYRLIENFDLIQLIEESICTTDTLNKIVECVWELGEINSVYELFSERDIKFKITVVDFYGNSVNSELNLTLDNKPAKITNIQIIENEDIKDKILKSGENIDLRILVEDDNLDISNNYFISAYLGRLDLVHDQFVDGSCYQYNTTVAECDFRDITLRNGHVNESVTFRVYDAAGNKYFENFFIEIFKIANEEIEIFKKDTIIDILNPINRDFIATESVDAWFTGELKLINGSDILSTDYRIINYQIKFCNESGLDPLILINPPILFPEDVVICEFENLEDCPNFNIKAELRDHSNFDDLNNKTIDCSISVLKRDSEKVYPPELVKIRLNFGFYDIPRGSLINAKAKDIMEDIEKTEFLSNWLDKIHGYYNIFSNVCNTVNTATGIISNIYNIWTYAAIALSKTPAIAATEATDKAISTADSAASQLTFGTNLQKPIQKMCAFVTCQIGSEIMKEMESEGGITGKIAEAQNNGLLGSVKALQGFSNKMAAASCSKPIKE